MDADRLRRQKAGQSAAGRRRAEQTKCPKCGRKSSLRSHTEYFADGNWLITVWCWREDCDYARESWRYE